jgi:transposase
VRIDSIDVEATIERVKVLLAEESAISPALKSALEVLLLLVAALLSRVGLNSSNSSKPPSADPNRKRQPKRGERRPGGQKGRNGTTLKPVPNPDKVEALSVDRTRLPPGQYKTVGFEARQVIDIEFLRTVTEYRAEILEDANGQRFKAAFPDGVDAHVQYGNGVKAYAVYLSQYQLLPYNRIEECFRDQLGIPISAGTIVNFNREAGERLLAFDAWVKDQLHASPLLHVDETSVNINGKRHWLHCAANDRYTAYAVHPKRGTEAMDAMGILPGFQGVLCHDHWKPYYRYQSCLHALCNAHHLRELERAWEQDEQVWAANMQGLLLEINRTLIDARDVLPEDASEAFRQRYRQLLDRADIECPPPDQNRPPGQRGRVKRSKARNLLERLREYEDDVLRFMVDSAVPFTNNLAEGTLRMSKLQQKISGCFRSLEGARRFCSVRGYVSTCRKHGISPSEALRLLFEGRFPHFMDI